MGSLIIAIIAICIGSVLLVHNFTWKQVVAICLYFNGFIYFFALALTQ